MGNEIPEVASFGRCGLTPTSAASELWRKKPPNKESLGILCGEHLSQPQRADRITKKKGPADSGGGWRILKKLEGHPRRNRLSTAPTITSGGKTSLSREKGVGLNRD